MVGFQKEKVERREQRRLQSFFFFFAPKRNHSDWHFEVVARETGSKLSRIALWDPFEDTIFSFIGYYVVV